MQQSSFSLSDQVRKILDLRHSSLPHPYSDNIRTDKKKNEPSEINYAGNTGKARKNSAKARLLISDEMFNIIVKTNLWPEGTESSSRLKTPAQQPLLPGGSHLNWKEENTALDVLAALMFWSTQE